MAPVPDLSYASGRQEGPVHAKTALFVVSDMDDTFNNPSIYETENGRFGERKPYNYGGICCIVWVLRRLTATADCMKVNKGPNQ